MFSLGEQTPPPKSLIYKDARHLPSKDLQGPPFWGAHRLRGAVAPRHKCPPEGGALDPRRGGISALPELPDGQDSPPHGHAGQPCGLPTCPRCGAALPTGGRPSGLTRFACRCACRRFSSFPLNTGTGQPCSLLNWCGGARVGVQPAQGGAAPGGLGAASPLPRSARGAGGTPWGPCPPPSGGLLLVAKPPTRTFRSLVCWRLVLTRLPAGGKLAPHGIRNTESRTKDRAGGSSDAAPRPARRRAA